MATLAELRQKAKGLGIAPSVIRSAESASELQSIIAENSDEAPRAKAKAKAKHKGTTAKAKASKASKSKATKAKAGNSKSASSKSAPAAKKSAKAGKAKRPTAAKATHGTDGPSGRHLLDGVNFSETDGWNPRAGSAPDRIVKALRKAKGNRSKVFDALVGDLWDFVGKKKADGSKRTKAEAEAMLRYRISRTAWDFALATGQHDKSENRAQYGTAGTGAGIFKPAKSKSRKASSASKGKTTKAKSNSKTKAKKGGKTKAKAGKR